MTRAAARVPLTAQFAALVVLAAAAVTRALGVW